MGGGSSGDVKNCPIIVVNDTPDGFSVEILGPKSWWHEDVKNYFLKHGLLQGDGDLDNHIQHLIRQHIMMFVTDINDKHLATEPETLFIKCTDPRCFPEHEFTAECQSVCVCKKLKDVIQWSWD